MVERQEDNGDERDDESGPDELGAPAPLGDPGPTATGGGGTRGGAWRPRGPRSGWWLLAVPVVLVALALAPTVISGLKKTPRDRVGISYGGGPVEGGRTSSESCSRAPACSSTASSTRCTCTRATRQNYIVSKQPGQGAEPRSDSIVAPTSDRVQVDVPGGRVLQAEHRSAARLPRAARPPVQGVHDRRLERASSATRSGSRSRTRSRRRPASSTSPISCGDADLLVELQDSVQTKLSAAARATRSGSRSSARPRSGPATIAATADLRDQEGRHPGRRWPRRSRTNRTSEIQVQTKENEVAPAGGGGSGDRRPQRGWHRPGDYVPPEGDRVREDQLLGAERRKWHHDHRPGHRHGLRPGADHTGVHDHDLDDDHHDDHRPRGRMTAGSLAGYLPPCGREPTEAHHQAVEAHGGEDQ